MEVFVDGNRVDDQAAGTGTLKDALMQVQSSLGAPDHIVVGIRCDGNDIVGDSMAATLEKPAASFTRVELFTSTREALVIDAMSQASTSLQETETACEQVVEQLSAGKTTEAVQTLGRCLKTWQQVHDAVGKSIQILQLDVERTTINDRPMLEVISQPKQTLLQIKQALQAQDHVLLADILQYELSDVTDHWFALIAHLREEAEQRRQPTE